MTDRAPEFYRANMDAWNDCMSYVDDPAAGMTAHHVRPGGVLTLQIPGLAKTLASITEHRQTAQAAAEWAGSNGGGAILSEGIRNVAAGASAIDPKWCPMSRRFRHTFADHH